MTADDSLAFEFRALRELAAKADSGYSYRNGEPANAELATAISAANAALQIVNTLVAMQTAKRDAARAQADADRATNLHSTLRDLLNEQRAQEI